MQNTKVNSPGEQRLGENWRIYIISKELYCFTPLLTNQVQIQVKIQMLPKNGTQEKVISASTCTMTNTQNLPGYPVEGFVQNILDSWAFLIIVDDADQRFWRPECNHYQHSVVRLGLGACSPHVKESRFWNTGNFSLWNPGNFLLCNPESWALESRIQLKESGMPH